MTTNVNSIQREIRIKNRIIKRVIVDVKVIASAKKIIVGILPHLFVRMVII